MRARGRRVIVHSEARSPTPCRRRRQTQPFVSRQGVRLTDEAEALERLLTPAGA